MANRLASPPDECFVQPIKRASQACENCRRKKSRCPGEKPRCSVCLRLRQQCVYAQKVIQPDKGPRGGIRKPRWIEANRLSTVETKLCELTQVLSAKGIMNSNDGGVEGLRHANDVTSIGSTPRSGTSQITNELEISDEIKEEGILLYFQHFHNQPYPLLMGINDSSDDSVAEYPKLVLFSLLAVSLRTCQKPLFPSKETLIETCEMLAEAAWNLLAAQYAKFDFDLAYFQALCLLAQGDFATGKPDRAQVQVALGLRLAQTRGLLRKECPREFGDSLPLSWHSVVWTLFMMDRIFSGESVRSSCVSASSFQLFLVQCAPPNPIAPSSFTKIRLPTSPGDILRRGPLDVVSCNIVLLDIWHSALMDVFDNDSSTTIPFWRRDSTHAAIESRLVEFEMKAHPHRYIAVGPPRCVLKEPHLRPFFSAWGFLQILYSAIRCCLHHPFVLFMKIRQQHDQFSLTTLQKSHQDSMIHSSWVIRLIIEIEEAGIPICDPFIGYLVALAASIQLEHTMNDNPKVANPARRKYDKAHNYLQRTARIWPNVGNILNVLENISVRIQARRTISHVHGEYDGAIPSEHISDVNVNQDDIDLMAKLFDYAALSTEQERMSSIVESTTEHYTQASITASNLAPQDNASASYDPAGMGDAQVHSDSLAMSEELDWINEDYTLPDLSNDWSFFGQPWSTHFAEGLT